LSSCSRCILPYPHFCLLYVEFFVLVNGILRLATKTNNASKSWLEKKHEKTNSKTAQQKTSFRGKT